MFVSKQASVRMPFLFRGGGWSLDYFLALLGKDVVRSFALRPNQLASEGWEQMPRNARIHPRHCSHLLSWETPIGCLFCFVVGDGLWTISLPFWARMWFALLLCARISSLVKGGSKSLATRESTLDIVRTCLWTHFSAGRRGRRPLQDFLDSFRHPTGATSLEDGGILRFAPPIHIFAKKRA